MAHGVMTSVHRPHTEMYCLAVILPVSCLVYQFARFCHKTFKPDGELDQIIHDKFMRTFALGIAAAQASSLLCVDWATSFYVLTLVVPLLSGHSDIQHSVLHLLLTGFVAVALALLVLCFCFLFMANTAFEPLFQSLQSATGLLPDILSQITTSWDTSCLGAVLTLLTPVWLYKYT